jgi:hypothetical protein
MAGFYHHAPASADISMIAYLPVTLLVDLGEGEGVVYQASGRHERGSVVARPLPGRSPGNWPGVGQLLQIRLDPVAAATLLGGASAELSGTVAALEDWGRDAGKPRTGCAPPRRGTNASWQARTAQAP